MYIDLLNIDIFYISVSSIRIIKYQSFNHIWSLIIEYSYEIKYNQKINLWSRGRIDQHSPTWKSSMIFTFLWWRRRAERSISAEVYIQPSGCVAVRTDIRYSTLKRYSKRPTERGREGEIGIVLHTFVSCWRAHLSENRTATLRREQFSFRAKLRGKQTE